MTLDNYRRDIAVRDQLRSAYQKLVIEFDACITLSAPGAAPVGIGWTGDPVFNAPASLLGIPALSLPVLADEGMPLGLQLRGFAHRDAALFGTAAWVMGIVKG
jgi:Asp-tRNA(Asn)/Glu-tRNA(Gln) amidotransferase A subunit family amidase